MKKLGLMGLLSLSLIGCSNVEEKMNNKAMGQIERGNYIQASFLLSDAININPDYLDGVVNYRNVYPRAIDQANDNIKEYEKVSDYKLEAFAYEDLLELKNNYYSADDLIHQKLEMSLEVPTIEEIYDIKTKTGTLYYEAGNELENRRLNRIENRDRYYLYKRGVELYPKYRDIVERRQNAYNSALVKTMINYSNNTPTTIMNNLGVQIQSNLAKDRKKSLIRVVGLDRSKFNLLWENNNNQNISLNKSVLNDVNTGIYINLDYITVTPESRTKEIEPMTWNQEYIVQTQNGPIKKTISHTYFRSVYRKRADVNVSFSYVMKDLKTGEIIGSGTYKGRANDSFSWSRYSGDIPEGRNNDDYIRNLKSRKELTDEAISESVLKLSFDISKKI